MAKTGKQYNQAREKVDASRFYPLSEAVETVKNLAFAGFDETVELIVTLDIDPKKSDQMVRGTVSLPHGTGKKVRVLAFCPADRVDDALAAGADYAGGGDLVEKIKGGWLDFDAAVAEKSIMREISSLGKVLGPRGLMPSPKSGTVTEDLPRTIRELKAGQIEIKTNKGGVIQVAVGKVSFAAGQLAENILCVMGEIIRLRPAAVKGKYVKKAFLCATMSPALALETGSLSQGVAAG
jgi:large subunit ribosomal protein L1